MFLETLIEHQPLDRDLTVGDGGVFARREGFRFELILNLFSFLNFGLISGPES